MDDDFKQMLKEKFNRRNHREDFIKSFFIFIFSKKAQTEIIGLVIIVLIISIAMMFLLFFVTKGNADDSLNTFDNNLHAYNTIVSIIQTNTECRSYTFSDLIKQCVLSPTQYLQQDCNPEPITTCEFVEREISYILEQSLKSVNEEYKFYIYTEINPTPIIDLSSENADTLCQSKVTSATQPIRYGAGDLFVTLDICG